jgi:hypothetical protein
MIIRNSHDPLIGRFLDTALDNIEHRSSNNVWQVTGPGILAEMWENGEDPNLLDGFCLLSPVRIAQYISLYSLPYAENGMHWSEAQKKFSIFVGQDNSHVF